jgi:hypothetical protein
MAKLRYGKSADVPIAEEACTFPAEKALAALD